jgi:hypothetical protein
MDPQNEFIKNFIETGRSRGYTDDEIKKKLEPALIDFSKSNPQPEQPQTPQAPQPNLLQEIGKAIVTPFKEGMKDVNVITNSIKTDLTPEYHMLLKKAESGQVLTDEETKKLSRYSETFSGKDINAPDQIDPALADWMYYSPEELQKNFGQGIVHTTEKTLGTSAGIGSWFIPGGGAIVGGTEKISTIAAQTGFKVAAKAALESLANIGIHGAVGGATSEFSREVSNDEQLDGTKIANASLFSAAVPIVMKVISKAPGVVGDFLKNSKTLGGPGFYNSALDLEKKALENEVRTGQYLATEAMNRKAVGTETQIIKQAKEGQGVAWNELMAAAKANPEAKVDIVSIVDDVVNPAIKQAKDAGENDVAKQLEKWGTDFLENNGGGKPLDLSKSMEVRKALDTSVRSTFGKEVSKIDSETNLAKRLIADNMRGRIRTLYPDLAPALDNYHFWSRMEDAMVSKRAFAMQGGAVPKSMWSALSWILKPVRSSAVMTGAGQVVNAAGKGLSAVESGMTSRAPRLLENWLYGGVQNSGGQK